MNTLHEVMNIIREAAAIEKHAQSLKKVNTKALLKRYRKLGEGCRDFLFRHSNPANVDHGDTLRHLLDMEVYAKELLLKIQKCKKELRPDKG